MTQSAFDRTSLSADVHPQEQELLVRLMEEAGELAQACSKTLRFGWTSVNPTLPDDAPIIPNRLQVRNEIADILEIAYRLGLLPLTHEVAHDRK